MGRGGKESWGGRGGKEPWGGEVRSYGEGCWDVALPAAIFDVLIYDPHVCALLNMAHTDLCLLLTWLCQQT